MKKTLIFTIIGALVVGVVAFILIFKIQPGVDNVDNQNSANNSESNNQQTSEPISGKGSLNSLLALTKNLECTIEYTASTSEPAISGSYFVSEGKLRGDFVVPSTGMNGDIISSMIMANDMFYSWSEIEGQSYGMKMTINENQEIKNETNTPDSHEAVPLEAEVNYNCKPWLIVDASIFEPPADVLFKEYDTAVKSGMEYGTVYDEASTTQSPCALCEQVPAGEGRTQCKANFKCSE